MREKAPIKSLGPLVTLLALADTIQKECGEYPKCTVETVRHLCYRLSIPTIRIEIGSYAVTEANAKNIREHWEETHLSVSARFHRGETDPEALAYGRGYEAGAKVKSREKLKHRRIPKEKFIFEKSHGR